MRTGRERGGERNEQSNNRTDNLMDLHSHTDNRNAPRIWVLYQGAISEAAELRARTVSGRRRSSVVVVVVGPRRQSLQPPPARSSLASASPTHPPRRSSRTRTHRACPRGLGNRPGACRSWRVCSRAPGLAHGLAWHRTFIAIGRRSIASTACFARAATETLLPKSPHTGTPSRFASQSRAPPGFPISDFRFK